MSRQVTLMVTPGLLAEPSRPQKLMVLVPAEALKPGQLLA